MHTARTRRGLLLLTLAWTALVCVVSLQDTAAPFGVLTGGARFVADNFDRFSYLYRGQWALTGGIPYRSHYSDYPFPMTLYYGLPHLLIPAPHLRALFFPVSNWFWFAALLACALPATANARTFCIFWALPTTWYFVANRFDIIPVTLSAAALLLLPRRPAGSALLLALAVNVKWYPAALLLPALAFLRAQGASWPALLRYAGIVILVTLALHAAAFALAGSASFDAYRFHHERPVESASLYALLTLLLPGAFADCLSYAAWLLALLLPLARPPRTQPALLAQGAACLILLIAGSRIYSPQWLLWYGALAALVLTERRDLLLLAGVSLATYLRFPVCFDLWGDAAAHRLAAALVWLLNGLLLRRLLRRRETPTP